VSYDRTALGLDPGGVTGLALINYNHVSGYAPLSNHGCIGEFRNRADVVINVRVLLGLADILAAERFVVGQRAARSRSAQAGAAARDILGAVQQAARDADVPVRVKLRSASEVKAWATDKRLKAAGLFDLTAKTISHHDARDAARHALMALVFDLGCPDPLSSTYRPGEAGAQEVR
jgi:hypothetical protein